MGRPFCKNFLIVVKRPRDSRKKSDWFRCKKISQKLKYLNFKCEQSERYFFVLFYSFHHSAHVPCEKREWKSGFRRLRNIFKKIYGTFPDLTGTNQSWVSPEPGHGQPFFLLGYYATGLVSLCICAYRCRDVHYLVLDVTDIIGVADNPYSIWICT